MRRGLGDPAAARAWLEARDAHPPSAFAGIDRAVELVLDHVGARLADHRPRRLRRRRRLLDGDPRARAARRSGADVDWYLPSRTEDGYGLSAATVERLAARGTQPAAHRRLRDHRGRRGRGGARGRAWTSSSPTTTTPRADGALPDAPIVHPALCGYPCPDLCAAGVAYKLAARAARGRRPRPAGRRRRPRPRRAGHRRRLRAAARREPPPRPRGPARARARRAARACAR